MLSAGVGNDVVGWILLALCVALVNAGTGLTALWILLTCIGYVLFLVFAVRPIFIRILTHTRSLQDGPSQSVVALTLLIALTSSFFTGVIGVHPIFGAFMAGLICPHEGGFAIKLTEKIEDLVSALFLPLYFALSGLSTDLGLLNNGITWAYVFGVIAVAFFAKVIGGSGAARLNGRVWRECFTIGALMSCKGLVELIVLNIGLQAKILSTRTFTIFVLMALVTTFATTPLVSALYPPAYQRKLERWRNGEIDWNTGRPVGETSDDDAAYTSEGLLKGQVVYFNKMLFHLRLDNMPSLLALIAMLGRANEACLDIKRRSPDVPASQKRPWGSTEMHGVRLLELTERDSSVMKVSEADEYSTLDPIVNTFRALGRLHGVPVSGEVIVVPESYYAQTLSTRAADLSSDLLLLPWSETGSMSETQTVSKSDFGNRLGNGAYPDFVRDTLREARCAVGIFVNKGLGGINMQNPRGLSRVVSGISMRGTNEAVPDPIREQTHRVFMAYTGSQDDRVALAFVLRLSHDPRVTVNIAHLIGPSKTDTEDLPSGSSGGVSQQVGKSNGTHTAIEFIPLDEVHGTFLTGLLSSLPLEVSQRVIKRRVQVENNSRSEVLEQAKLAFEASGDNAGDLIVLGRNARDDDTATSCLGSMGDFFARSETLGVEASLLVVQAGRQDDLEWN